MTIKKINVSDAYNLVIYDDGTSIISRRKIEWYFIVAVLILDVAIYAFALLERDKFHTERYEELGKFNERLIDMLPERQHSQKSH